jgi:hypothetical protein
MRHRSLWLTATLLALASAAGLAGCAASSTDAEYPRLGPIATIKQKLLSKEEQDKAIRELSLEQSKERAGAQQR